MSDLYLNPGESLILTTNRISINFIPFDVMLTSMRLILLDSLHDRFSPQVIPLGDIFSVNGGTISTGEPIIRITITGEENDGSHIPIDFIFVQAANQKRKPERDAWLRTLMERLVEVRQEKVLNGIDPSGEEDRKSPLVRRWIAPEILYPMPLVAGPDLPAAEPENASAVTESPDAGENSAREPEPVRYPAPEFEGPPVPAEPDNEMPGETSGTERETAGDLSVREPEPAWEETWSAREEEPVLPVAAISGTESPDEPARVREEEPAGEVNESSPGVPSVGTIPEPPAPDESVPEMTVTPTSLTPPVVNWPVIREEPVPIVPGTEKPDTATPPPAISNPPEDQENAPGSSPVSTVAEEGTYEQFTVSASEPASPPSDRSRETTTAGTGEEAVHGSLATRSPASGLPTRVPVTNAGTGTPPDNRTMMISIAVVAGIILVIAALVLLTAHTPAAETLPVPAITPAITANTTPEVRPAPVPDVGVWVRVSYPGYYYGQIGNPAGLQEIGGTGDQFYFIRNSGSLVQADIQKRDNSGDTLAVSIFNNGTQVFTTSVRSPMGTIGILIDPATGKPPK